MRMVIPTRWKIGAAHLVSAPVILVRRIARRGPETTVVRRGVRWSLDLREGIDFAIWLNGSFEPSTRHAYEGIVSAGDQVIDVGANVGAHTMHLARAVGPTGTVVAIEPTKFAFQKLLGNLELNPDLKGRVLPRQAIVVGEPGAKGPEQLYSGWPLAGEADLHPKHRGRPESTAGARALTLDELVADPRDVNLIKLDVDGHECDVLRGGTRVLSESSPPILLELAPYVFEDTAGSLEELVDILHEHGYELRTMDDSRQLPGSASELRAQIPDGGSLNALARVSGST